MLLSKKIIVDGYYFYLSIILRKSLGSKTWNAGLFNYCVEHFIEFLTFWLICWKVIACRDTRVYKEKN